MTFTIDKGKDIGIDYVFVNVMQYNVMSKCVFFVPVFSHISEYNWPACNGKN